MTIKRLLSSSIVIITARMILGLVFLWAGFAKIPYPLDFVSIVKAYDILPDGIILPVAVVMPWVEAVVGVCFFLGIWTRSSAFVALCLLQTFSLALAVNIYRGADIACGCFGFDASRYTLEVALLQDVALIVFVFVVFVSPHSPLSVDAILPGKEPDGVVS